MEAGKGKDMERHVTAGLKYTFLVHGIMMSIFGLIYIFFPLLWGELTGCLSSQTPGVFRLLGATLLGLALGSLLAYPETSWDRTRIVAQMQCVTNILFSVVILVVFFTTGLPTIGWMYFVVMTGFAIAFNIVYLRGPQTTP
jgi:uncharacterized protein YjeT (DUF2065 family)